LLLFLLVPLCYRLDGKKEDEVYVKGRISWLFRVVYGTLLFDGDNIRTSLRILGIPVSGRKNKKEKFKKRKKQKKSKKPKEEKPEVVALERKEEKKKDTPKIPKKEEKQKNEKPFREESFDEEIKKPENKESVSDKGKRAFESVDKLKAFWRENKEDFFYVFHKFRDFYRKIRPKKLEVTLYYGTGDPCMTGELTGVLALFYGFYGDKLNLYPDFTQAVFQGELSMAGKIRLFTFLRICITVVSDKKIKLLVTNIRNLKEDL
jgi:hypothetical protein